MPKTQKSKDQSQKKSLKKQNKESAFDIQKTLSQISHTPSQHIVNLKKIAHEKELTAHTQKRALSDVTSQAIFTIDKKLSATRKKFHSTLKPIVKKQNAPQYIPPQTTPIYTMELEGHNLVHALVADKKKQYTKNFFHKAYKIIASITLPKVTLPTLTLPRIVLPSFSLTRITFPKRNIIALKTATIFGVIALLIISPLLTLEYYQNVNESKGKVLGMAHAALDHIKKSKDVIELKDFASASYELTEARNYFAQALEEIQEIPTLIQVGAQAIPQGEILKDTQTLLSISQSILNVASQVLLVFENNDEATLAEKLTNISTALRAEKTNLETLNKQLQTINVEAFPKEYQNVLAQIISYHNSFTHYIDSLLEYHELVHKIIGGDSKQRYLLVFQNPNELRATGGFMGSFAQIDIDKGEVSNIFIPQGGTYDLEAGLDTNLTPPEPFTVINDRWEIQDSNYYPDFKKSAEQIAWFYEHSGQSTVDGVIAMTPSLITRTLALTGPIYLQSRDMMIDSENFVSIVQHEAEVGVDTLDNKPKKIIAEIAPLILQKILTLSTVQISSLSSSLHDALLTKEIQLYFSNPELQKIASEFNWTGEIKNTEGDYLHISTTNVAGGKSDEVISDVVSLEVDLTTSQPLHTLTITRTHSGDKSNVISGVKHNDYLRVYVPLGSQLVATHGFEPITEKHTKDIVTEPAPEIVTQESTATFDSVTQTKIYQEDNKTVFANWVQTEVGETQIIQIQYTTPEKIGDTTANSPLQSIANLFVDNEAYDTYSLYLQKQAGKKPTEYIVSVNIPARTNIAWVYPSTGNSTQSSYTFHEDLTKDSLIGVVTKSIK